MSRLPARPFLAPGFTVLSGPDRVRLVAGEDFRYTLSGPGLEAWLPAWLEGLDGGCTADELLALLPEEQRALGREVLAGLYGERVVLDGPAAAAHVPARSVPVVEGTGPLADALRAAAGDADGRVVKVLAQDRLDYNEVLHFNRRCLAGRAPWLWVTCGPSSRGYVSPSFLPNVGPCLECLVGHFVRLSPAPEIYDDLIAHARQGRPITPAPFPGHGARVLRELVLWKVELLGRDDPPAALFRLHVLEVATLEVTAHRVFRDPECPACEGRR
jgi:bacteriocin biosynthesis cyclodehydratase domain-containing protein